MHPPKGYKYLSLLGKGQAITWLAESIDDGQEVVIKTLELKNVSSWKGIELFEREVRVLQQLDHPSIPKFIDFIKDEYEGAKRWHIVQEKVEGEKPDPIPSWSQDELGELAESVLESLLYLQSFSPPLLHRDIKPDNLIRKEKGYALIDFGSVRHIIPDEIGGSTIVGTIGYLAPEQLMGRANPSSDLYGLGMTLIYLMTGTHPDELHRDALKIQWRSENRVTLEPNFEAFVNQLIEPHIEDRFENAEAALRRLKKPKTRAPKTGGLDAQLNRMIIRSKPAKDLVVQSKPPPTLVVQTKKKSPLFFQIPAIIVFVGFCYLTYVVYPFGLLWIAFVLIYLLTQKLGWY